MSVWVDAVEACLVVAVEKGSTVFFSSDELRMLDVDADWIAVIVSVVSFKISCADDDDDDGATFLTTWLSERLFLLISLPAEAFF